VAGNDVRIEYNTFTQNHDEFPDVTAPPGGEVFLAENVSTNFTILNNVIDGNYSQCNSATGCNGNNLTCNAMSNCTVSGLTTSGSLSWTVPYNRPMITSGI